MIRKVQEMIKDQRWSKGSGRQGGRQAEKISSPEESEMEAVLRLVWA